MTAAKEYESEIALKTCAIVTLASLAEVHRLLEQRSQDSHRKCLDAVVQMVKVTETFEDEDYRFLDPILLVCISWLCVAK